MKTLEEALAAIEKLNASLEKQTASIEKLEAKNAELITEKKKAREEADAAKEAAEEAAEEKARANKDVEALEKQITKKFEKQINELTKANQGYESQLQTLLIDNAIQSNLTKHNVAGPYQKAVAAMLRMEAKLEGGEAKVNGVSLEEHIASFIATDEGKAFVAAPANTGASATGSRTQVAQVPSNWNLTQYIQMKASDPDGAAAYATKHGKSFD